MWSRRAAMSAAWSQQLPGAADGLRWYGDAGLLERTEEARPQPGGAQLAGPGVVDEEILHGDDVALHTEDLGDVGDAARAVAQPGLLDDDVDGGGDLLADRADRQVH